MVGAKALALVGASFTLSWVHSVEKTGWFERWEVTPAGLHLTEARVQGSGAGMDPGEGAKLVDGWWVWKPTLPPLPELILGDSGATVSPWTLCTGTTCMALGQKPGPAIHIRPCGKDGS
ncbi:MAG: DUF1850 domain-containing protein [Rhodobacteraceae bacterium]|nr:DUF1850 domain-containing protein [Paracoccaceae bacterium]